MAVGERKTLPGVGGKIDQRSISPEVEEAIRTGKGSGTSQTSKGTESFRAEEARLRREN